MKKIILLIALLLVARTVLAQDKVKPNIPSWINLNEEQQVEVKEYLKGKVFVDHVPTKNDYVDKHDRGSVKFNPRKGINRFGREVFVASNYSGHKVTIPDGTTVHDINFSQKNPHTNAIKGKNLTFIHCNLTNIVIDPTWTLESCINRHSRYRIVVDGDKTYDVHEVEEDGIFKELSRHDITGFDTE